VQKQTVLDVVEAMPDNVDVNQLLDKLYVLQKIEAGERALAEQGGVPQEVVEKQFGV
jgi:hypothetical protein